MTPTHPFPLTTRLRLALYTIALVSVAAFAHTESSLAYLFPSLIVAAIAWLLVDSSYAPSLDALLAGPNAPSTDKILRWLLRHAPKLLLNLIVLVAAIYFWIEVRLQVAYRTDRLIFALAHFIIVLLLSKLFERKTPRDAVEVLVLSFLLTVAATIFSTEGLFFFTILAVFFSLCVYAIMLLNVSSAITGLAAPNPIPAAIPLNGLTRNGRGDKNAPLHLFRRDLIAAAKYCLFLTLPIAIGIFLAVPRSRGNPLLSPLGLGAEQTGYSEIPQLRDYGQLQQSDREVMRVSLQRRGLEDATSDYSDLYFRGQVFDLFGPTGWSHSYSRPATPASPAGSGPATPDLTPVSSGIKVTYVLQHLTGQTLFVLGPSQDPAADNLAYRPDDMVLRLARPRPRTAEPFTYSLFWNPELAPGIPGEPFCEPGILAPAGRIRNSNGAAVEFPAFKVSPQIDELAHRLVKDLLPPAGNPEPDQIRPVLNAFQTYLRANYPYSLTYKRVDPALDHITDFLVNRKDSGGHCEYFASAFVMMCRAVGINARRVDGFHGGEYVPATIGNISYFLVRDKHAHAWAEAYIPGQGWVLCDATPIGSGAEADALNGNWLKDISRIIQSAWLATVISFDNDSRNALARWLSERFNAILSTPSWPVAIAVFLWLATLALILLLIRLRRRFRALQPLLESTQGLPHRQLRLTSHIPFLEALLQLFERAAPRRPDLTPLEFLQPHFPRLGTAAHDARWLIHTAYAIRFNNLRLDPALKLDIARALKSVKAAQQNP